MILYQNKYNLSTKGQEVSGELVIAKDSIKTIEDSIETKKVDIENVKEIYLQNNVASAQLVVRLKDDNCILLCGFTMEFIKAIGEICKGTNFYINTGEYEKIVQDKTTIEVLNPEKNTPISFKKMDTRKIASRFIMFIGKYKSKLILASALAAFSNVAFMLVPYFNQILIDKYLTPKYGTVINLLIICGAIFFARAIGEVMIIISSRIITINTQKLTADIRMQAYQNVQKLSMNSLSEKTTGDLMQRIMSDVSNIRSFLENQGRYILEQAIVLITVGIILFSTNAKMAIIVILPFPIVLLIVLGLRETIRLCYTTQWIVESKAATILHDIISGIKVVKSFGSEKNEIKKYSKASKEQADVSTKNERLWGIVFPIFGFFIGIGEYFVLYFGGFEILGGTFTKGELVSFIMYIAFIYRPINWMIYLPRQIGQTVVSLTKVIEIIDEEPTIINSTKATMPNINADIKLNDIVFGYKSYEPILKNITADIKQGEMIGLVGASGSGKSTTINLLLRLYDVDSGSININNENIKDIEISHLHQNTGIVFQDVFLFVGSIFENIKYTNDKATIDDVIAVSKICEAHDFIIKLPDGYNTIIGQNGYNLSGGERQRIAIARAIIGNPSLLILDEATSSLDAQTEEKIQEALQKVIKGRTTIAIAHKLSTLKNADRLFVMDKGNIIEKGTHKELLAKKGAYYDLVMAQLQINSKKPIDDSFIQNETS